MGRIKKKGTAGAAKSYITRTQAVRKLQISLPDFRRLCIFKGIYPREPRNKKKASKTATPASTFYYSKDIQYLLHEPLLAKFRDHKALAKKIGRYLGRGEVGDAARLERTQKPRITLDHIIKERYPTFIDALRDLDDCLSMLFLFANLPSTFTIPPKTIAICQRLCLEFQHYLIVTNSLRKSFLSIKGIYYQATIQGQDILWLVPYKFVQNVSGDIDFRIMGTFVEFYTTLLGFVNFRLYTSVGLVYPPKFDAMSDDRGAELGAITLQTRAIDSAPTQKRIDANDGAITNGHSKELTVATERAQAAADALKESSTTVSNGSVNRGVVSGQDEEEDGDLPNPELEPENSIDAFPVSTSADADTLPQPAPGSNEAANLFAPFMFYLSRETPRQPLEFILKAFGCKRIGWDAVLGDGAFTTNELDPAITHQIVDRPPVMPVPSEADDGETTKADDSENVPRAAPRGRVPGRTYIQPQWVWDCANAGKLLRPDLYAPGATLPPHLSPWVKPTAGAYDPTAPLDINGDEGDLTSTRAEIAGAADNKSEDDAELSEEDLEEDEVDIEDGDELNLSSKKGDWAGFTSGSDDDALGNGDEDEADDDDDAAAKQAQRELEAEAAGQRPSKNGAGEMLLKSALKKPSRAQREAREKQEQLERQKMMMPRRKRKLFEKMQYSNAKKEEEKEKLTTKRRRIEGRARA